MIASNDLIIYYYVYIYIEQNDHARGRWGGGYSEGLRISLLLSIKT